MKVEDPDGAVIDELLESVDLSSYGLQRVKLNHSILLTDQESELDPQNPNPRGAHGTDKVTDPLDDIIRTFNERWFQGWSATPEEQRIRMLSMRDALKNHPDFTSKYVENADPHNRELAFEKMFKEIMLQKRKDDLDFYKLSAADQAFKTSLINSLRMLVQVP
ncbi:hypothetical protein DFP77_1641 [Marinomonas foliarum]|uniref:Uncharacterized protein n=1 Tax=Marinomonas foliarum TaxID=491950 RepID=A0A368ZD40_9GAMM|nr:hypothetical protein DFP77_1641 [Marinomonas foliarum]